MSIKIIVNPENATEILGTLDGREPKENDHDFGADFYWQDNEIDVINAVEAIVNKFNGVK